MNPSGSSLARAEACPASHVLPRVNEQGKAASRGVSLHSFFEAALTKGLETALAECPEEYRAIAESIDLADLPTDPKAYAAEVAFALDVETGLAREIGRSIGRNYPKLGPNEIALTADIIALGADFVLVEDWKTGHGHVEPARTNHQMRALAVAASRAYGKDSAKLCIRHVRENGFIWRDRATMDAFDLDDAMVQIREIVQRVKRTEYVYKRGELPPVYMGDHCKWCPSQRHCPGQTALIRQVVGAPNDLMVPITAQNAAEAYEKVRAAKAILGKVEAAVYAFASQEPIALGDGKVLGPVTTKRREISGPVAQRVLREQFDLATADAACEVDSSRAAIERALRPVAKVRGATLKGLVDEVVAAIEAADGVTVKESTSIREHDVKQAEQAA